MSGTSDVDATVEQSPEVLRPDYSGAIYGSLLAASVVVGTAASGDYDVRPWRLAGLLIATGLVFWVAHAYARLVGDRIHHAALNRREIVSVGRREWPLLQTAFPPAAAALLTGLLGASNETAAWAALIVALAAQVGWATLASIRSGANGRLIFVTILVNIGLGLIIVFLKSALYH
jgi:hypothetical protein